MTALSLGDGLIGSPLSRIAATMQAAIRTAPFSLEVIAEIDCGTNVVRIGFGKTYTPKLFVLWM